MKDKNNTVTGANLSRGVEISLLQPNMLDEAVKVFLSAFQNEAFTVAWLDLSRTRLRSLYSRAVRRKLELYLDAGHPLYSAVEKDRLIGLLVLKTPHIIISRAKIARLLPSLMPVLVGLIPNFIRAIPLGLAIKSPPNLPAAHYTVEALAVDPCFQGKGVGALLLEQAKKVCFADKTASGVYLFTGDEQNRAIYEKKGYQLLEKRNTGTFTSHHMFLAKRDTTDSS